MSIIKITSTRYFFILFYLLTGLPDYQQVAFNDRYDRLTAYKSSIYDVMLPDTAAPSSEGAG